MKKTILDVSKVLFVNRSEWGSISDQEKNENFFIFNRYFSKRYPHLSQMLNHKEQDKSIGLDIWFKFMENKPYPKWFWSKSEKKNFKEDSEYKKFLKEIKGFDDRDSDFLIKFFPDQVEEEFDYYKKLQKNQK